MFKKSDIKIEDIPEEVQQSILRDKEAGLTSDHIRKKHKLPRSIIVEFLGRTAMKKAEISSSQAKVIKKLVIEGYDDKFIGLEIGKPPQEITKFRILNKLEKDEDKEYYRDYKAILDKLRTRKFWPLLKKQMGTIETAFFEDRWANMLLQFKEDVTAVEEGHIQALIFLEIRLMRSGIEEQKLKEKIEDYDKQINDMYQLKPEERDEPKLMWLSTQRELLSSASKANAVEHSKILDSIAKFSTMLKSTRDQRFTRADDGKTSWNKLIRYFENAQNRETEGLEAEIRKIAMENQFEKFAEPHVYADGIADSPILSAETLEINERLIKEQEKTEQHENKT